MAKDKATPPPYPEHECEGCNRGRELVVSTAKSSIVGTAACHAPEGWACMKYIPPETYATLAKLREGRKMSDKETRKIRKNELKVAIYELRELIKLYPGSDVLPGLRVAIVELGKQIREINRER